VMFVWNRGGGQLAMMPGADHPINEGDYYPCVSIMIVMPMSG
jgi:hypothetical protein